jgi:hypothetical protein
LKKGIATLFLLTYLFTATEFNQLLKLPLLIEHFREHKQENKQITFLEFLSLHYKTTTIKDGDYEKDMKLPFKSQNDLFSAINAIHLFPNFDNLLNNITPISASSYVNKSIHFIDSFAINSIWQPPKSA